MNKDDKSEAASAVAVKDKVASLELNLETSGFIILKNGENSGVARLFQGSVLDRYGDSFTKIPGGLTARQQFHDAVKTKYALGRRAADRRIQMTKEIFKLDGLLKVKHEIENLIENGEIIDGEVIAKIAALIPDISTLGDAFRKAGILPKVVSDIKKKGEGNKKPLKDRLTRSVSTLKQIFEKEADNSDPTFLKITGSFDLLSEEIDAYQKEEKFVDTEAPVEENELEGSGV